MIVAATGHRPDKVGGYSAAASDVRVDVAIEWLREQEVPVTKGISGMALGWDQDFAIACIELDIPFIAAIPFVGQEAVWNRDCRRQYANILKYAAGRVIVSPGGFTVEKMSIRNRWMVDHADTMLALWDGTRGGTANCISYADMQGVDVENVYDRWINATPLYGVGT